MTSPGSYPSSYGSNHASSSFGGQASRTQPSVETIIERSWQFDQGQHKSKCHKDAAEFLERSFRKLAKSREPGEHDGAARQATIDRLQALLRDPQLFPPPSQLHLVPYGSFLSSCYSRSSDLDLALTGEVAPAVLGRREGFAPGPAVPLDKLNRDECVMLLRRLASALEVRHLTRGSVDRAPLEARVPIIKFEELTSGIECDVCVTTRGCDFKASIMRLLHGLQPSLAPLIQLVKLWAKQHDINTAHCSTLNSWSLALMVLFSLQSYPGGHLLPPLWRVFHDEEPMGPGGTGRPLQDKNLSLDVMLAVAESRCLEEGDRLVSSRWAESEPPGLLEQMLWFLSCFNTIMCQWRDNASHRNWRVSTWLGRGCIGRFPKAYVAAVEEPFDSNDNTARSLGIRERNENTLPYIAWVFGHSIHLLRNATSAEDSARILAWLFGPEALPCVGLPLLKMPTATVPEACMRLLERMAATERQPHPARSAADEPDREAEATAEFEKRLALRAMIDATRVGSPIMSLEEWRQHQLSSRSRPPHAWHPTPPLVPPPPPAPPLPRRMRGYFDPPQPPLPQLSYDQEVQLRAAVQQPPTANHQGPPMPQHQHPISDLERLYSYNHTVRLGPYNPHAAPGGIQFRGQPQPLVPSDDGQRRQSLSQDEGGLPPGLFPAASAGVVLGVGGLGPSAASSAPAAYGGAPYGLTGGLGNLFGPPGFAGLGAPGPSGAAFGGGLALGPQAQQQQQQQFTQQPHTQPSYPRGSDAGADSTGSGPQVPGVGASVGMALLEALRAGAATEKTQAVSERTRAATAAALEKVGLGPGSAAPAAAADARFPQPSPLSLFGGQSIGPSSAFSLHSAVPLQSPQQQQQPQRQDLQLLSHGTLSSASTALSLPFAMSLSASASLPLSQAPSGVPPDHQPQHQPYLLPNPREQLPEQRQQTAELEDLLRLLRVGPGNAGGPAAPAAAAPPSSGQLPLAASSSAIAASAAAMYGTYGSNPFNYLSVPGLQGTEFARANSSQAASTQGAGFAGLPGLGVAPGPLLDPARQQSWAYQHDPARHQHQHQQHGPSLQQQQQQQTGHTHFGAANGVDPGTSLLAHFQVSSRGPAAQAGGVDGGSGTAATTLGNIPLRHLQAHELHQQGQPQPQAARDSSVTAPSKTFASLLKSQAPAQLQQADSSLPRDGFFSHTAVAIGNGLMDGQPPGLAAYGGAPSRGAAIVGVDAVGANGSTGHASTADGTANGHAHAGPYDSTARRPAGSMRPPPGF